jgi:hypothetical protein
MMGKRRQHNAYLPPEKSAAMDQLHRITGVPKSRLYEEGVDLLLAFRAGAKDLGPEALEQRRQEVLERLRSGR